MGMNDVLNQISGFHIYETGERTGLSFVSGSLCEMTGYDRSEILNDYSTVVHEADRELFAGFLRELADTGEKRCTEYRLVKKNGDVILVREEAFPISGDDFEIYSGKESRDGAVNVHFAAVCMDITQRVVRKDREMKRYIAALADVYDKIFEYNFVRGTVKCLYSDNSPVFKHFENVPMQLEEATEKWISELVAESDAEEVRRFFEEFRQKRFILEDEKPHIIRYKAKSSDGQMRMYSGIFLKVDSDVCLYCCRRNEDMAADEMLKNENTNLKENMRRFVSRFTDGAVAFKITADGYAIPMYCSDNVCEFFGYSRDEWETLMENGMPIEQFVSHCDTDYEEFEKLLEVGEGEFSYRDIRTGELKNVRAICSQKELDGNSPRYIMLYSLDNAVGKNGASGGANVYIRTFGYFDVFVGDKPIAFRNRKSKELFALLVDRRGGFVTSDEAIGFLWEDESVNPVTLSRYRKVALRLKNTLESYGIADIVEAVDGKRRIVSERVRCDLYDYLTGDEEYAHLFKGSYLTNYSWGEMTLGELSS